MVTEQRADWWRTAAMISAYIMMSVTCSKGYAAAAAAVTACVNQTPEVMKHYTDDCGEDTTLFNNRESASEKGNSPLRWRKHFYIY